MNTHLLLRSALIFSFIAATLTVVPTVESATITGTVGSNMQHVDAAHVQLVDLEQHAFTDSSGVYTFKNVPKGTYLLAVSRLGYTSVSKRIVVGADDVTVDLELEESPLQSGSVVVSAERQPSTTLESPIAVSVQEGRTLDAARGQSIAGSINLLPGVREFTGGPVASKPVIRGLTSQRVLVAQDGVRMGSQSWDEPQAPEMTAFNVDRIEVVRGPNSVMYGSDAIGGVVNVIRSNIFNQQPGKLNGMLELNGFSNNTAGAGSITIGAVDEKAAFRVNVNGRMAGEYNAPSGTLPYQDTMLQSGRVFNSGASEFGVGAVGGIRGDWGTLSLDLSHFGQKVEITPEPGRLEHEHDPITGRVDTVPASPVQEIMHERAALSSTLFSGSTRFDLHAGFQYNSRKEEGVNNENEEESGQTPEVKLDLYTTTLEGKAIIGDIATVGISILHQRNQTMGRHAVIPNNKQLNLAGYAFREQPIVDGLRAIGSLRFDHRTLDAIGNTQLMSPDTSLTYDAFSGNVGLSWSLLDGLALTGNVGTGWRAPVAAELFGNGEDEGEVRYKRGNASLTPERSVNTELGMHVSTSSVRVDFAAYRNGIANYIGLQPTGDVEQGLNVYSYFQTQAAILGIEFSGEVDLMSWLILGAGVDILKGDDITSNQPLPLMPANRVQGWVTYHNPGWSWLQSFTASVKPRFVMQQDRIAAGETVTPSYTLLDASVGGIITVGSTGIRTDLVVQNVLNTAYVDHLSRYKAYAFNPGINAALKIAVPIL